MRYLILPDEASAMARSEQEAQARGCSGTTTHWWGWRETVSGEVALLIHDDETLGTDVEPEWPIEQVAQ